MLDNQSVSVPNVVGEDMSVKPVIENAKITQFKNLGRGAATGLLPGIAASLIVPAVTGYLMLRTSPITGHRRTLYIYACATNPCLYCRWLLPLWLFLFGWCTLRVRLVFNLLNLCVVNTQRACALSAPAGSLTAVRSRLNCSPYVPGWNVVG